MSYNSAISIHALREEGDHTSTGKEVAEENFYPRPPRGGRLIASHYLSFPFQFLSTPSARRATDGLRTRTAGHTFLSTPSARRATFRRGSGSSSKKISIHALREEGDVIQVGVPIDDKDFYPRPPRGGRRVGVSEHLRSRGHFYPRPPRGGRHNQLRAILASDEFLSTPSARRATLRSFDNTKSLQFLSTPSARRATVHALTVVVQRCDFYPRPPRGGRHDILPGDVGKVQFLSTPSARRATESGQGRLGSIPYFYPRPPRGGRPGDAGDVRLCRVDFYPRPPRGGRRYCKAATTICRRISIHALREEGDLSSDNFVLQDAQISIHALREEGDPESL